MGPGEGEALSRVESALEPLMPQHNDLSRSLLALDQASTLIAVIEMSQSSWLVAAVVPGIARHPLKKISPDEARCLADCTAGKTKRPKLGARLRASPSLMRPVATASGWRAGCGRAALRPMSFMQPAFPSRANTGEPKRTGSTPSCSSARFSAGCAASPTTAAWRPSRPWTRRMPSARAASGRPWSASAPGSRTDQGHAGPSWHPGLPALGLRNAPERLEVVRTPGAALPPDTRADVRRGKLQLA